MQPERLLNLNVLRVLRDGDAMTAFIKDTSFNKGGDIFLIFCQRIPDAALYVTTIFHALHGAMPFSPIEEKPEDGSQQ